MKALSIRQPWAWLILNGSKDVENRQWPTRFRGRFLIHASKGMTKAEYEDGLSLAAVINPDLVVAAPDFDTMQRGGIVGEVELVDCVTEMRSKWFFGRYGFVLRDPRIIPFEPMKGQLGFFEVERCANCSAMNGFHEIDCMADPGREPPFGAMHS